MHSKTFKTKHCEYLSMFSITVRQSSRLIAQRKIIGIVWLQITIDDFSLLINRKEDAYYVYTPNVCLLSYYAFVKDREKSRSCVIRKYSLLRSKFLRVVTIATRYRLTCFAKNFSRVTSYSNYHVGYNMYYLFRKGCART